MTIDDENEKKGQIHRKRAIIHLFDNIEQMIEAMMIHTSRLKELTLAKPEKSEGHASIKNDEKPN